MQTWWMRDMSILVYWKIGIYIYISAISDTIYRSRYISLTHTYMYIYICTYLYMYIYIISINQSINQYIYIYIMCICIYIYIHLIYVNIIHTHIHHISSISYVSHTHVCIYIYIYVYIYIYSRRFATATARTASFSSTAIVLFYCRRSATRTPVRPPRFERCCSHTFATARNCQWCRPLRPKTSESTDCRKKKREEFDSHV